MTKVVAFDDPSLSAPWDFFNLAAARMYFTIAQYESDIYVVDLEWYGSGTTRAQMRVQLTGDPWVPSD